MFVASWAELAPASIKLLEGLENWPAEQTRALTGRCRAAVLGNWAQNLDARAGRGSAASIATRLRAEGLEVERVEPSDWLNVGAQLRLTELLAADFLGGRRVDLAWSVVADVIAGTGRAASMAVRALGPRTLFDRFGDIHRAAYDVGRVSVTSARDRAELRFEDAELFGHPTWLALQTAAALSTLELTRTRGTVAIERFEPREARFEVRW